MDTDNLLRLEEATQKLRARSRTVVNLTRAGKGSPAIKISAQWMIPANNLDRWIRANTVSQSGAN